MPDRDEKGSASPATTGRSRRFIAGGLKWAPKGIAAIGDQALFAASNFALNIALARWLAPNDYGSFTFAFSIFLLAAAFHTSVLTEPMLVFGPGRYRSRLLPYLQTLVANHWKVVTLLVIVLASIGGVLYASGATTSGRSLIALSISLPFILFQWLMRRACYVNLRPHLAALAGGAYAGLLLVGIAVLLQLDHLTSTSAILLLGLASLVSGIWLCSLLEVTPIGTPHSAIEREVIADHLRYARWATATSFLIWVPGNIFYMLLTVTGDLHHVAGLRAALNVNLPFINLNFALGPLLVPALVGRKRDSSRLLMGVFAVILCGAPLLYWVFLVFYHPSLIDWLYDGQYLEYARITLILGILPITAGLTAIVGSALRAAERPDLVFWSYVGSGGFALIGGTWITVVYGVWGAASGMVLASLVTGTVMTYFLLGVSRTSALYNPS